MDIEAMAKRVAKSYSKYDTVGDTNADEIAEALAGSLRFNFRTKDVDVNGHTLTGSTAVPKRVVVNKRVDFSLSVLEVRDGIKVEIQATSEGERERVNSPTFKADEPVNTLEMFVARHADALLKKMV